MDKARNNSLRTFNLSFTFVLQFVATCKEAATRWENSVIVTADIKTPEAYVVFDTISLVFVDLAWDWSGQ
jgi:hypothetical protein